jgi:transposase
MVDGARPQRASAHYWARELTKLGHKVRLIEVLATSAGDAEKDAPQH